MRDRIRMGRRRLLAVLIWLPMPASAVARPAQPADVVAELYRVALGSGGEAGGVSVFADDRASERFLSHRLRAALNRMLRRTRSGYESSLDFDPVTNGNDPSVHDLHIQTESQHATRAVVRADFRSHQDTVRSVLRYFLVREDTGWKVDDIVASGKTKWRVSTLIGRG